MNLNRCRLFVKKKLISFNLRFLKPSLYLLYFTCIVDLKCEVSSLKQKVTKLENLIDNEDAYVRSESLILSGTMVPTSQALENCAPGDQE